MTSEAPVYAVIVAAGLGLRAGGGDTPKQFQPLLGKPLLSWSVEAFAEHPQIDGVLLVLHSLVLQTYFFNIKDPKLLKPVAGGAQRQDSVRNGLEALADRGPARVLIHDAARPLVSADVIGRVIAALDDAPGALPVVAVSDTLKRGRTGGVVEATVARDGLWRAQTPQGFDFRSILAAHRKFAGQNLTDDAAVAEAAGLAVKLVEGDARNIKITEAQDFVLAEAMLANSPSLRKRQGRDSNKVRRSLQSPLSHSLPEGEGKNSMPFTTTGQGFDVHRFVPGDGIWLCGIKIPSEWKLLGHSDADAGLHALTDAVLGAIAEGDIGVHFPPTNERWRDAASDQFLLHALKLMDERGGRLVHVDVTVICERPKVGPHRAAMRARLAELTGLPLERISIKGKTTEGLGFIGRNEGLATQAVATVAFNE